MEIPKMTLPKSGSRGYGTNDCTLTDQSAYPVVTIPVKWSEVQYMVFVAVQSDGNYVLFKDKGNQTLYYLSRGNTTVYPMSPQPSGSDTSFRLNFNTFSPVTWRIAIQTE